MAALNHLIRKITELVQADTGGDIQSIQKILALASKETGAAICLTDGKGHPIAGYTDGGRKRLLEKRLSPLENIGTLRIEQDAEPGALQEAMLDILICVILPLIQSINFRKNETALRDIAMVKSSIASLSYSELEAALRVFKELNCAEGVLVASKIAERAKITRPVIVNALRKLESAGLVETRSLGVKGTYIKVLNKFLLSELEKL